METLDELYAAVTPLSMDAGWRRTPGGRASGTFEPAHWRYRDGHAALEAAGRLVGPDLTERRNLMLMNPGGGGSTLATLVAAYQLVLPGERARSHRHTAGALRLGLDVPPGTYTIVDGVRLDMHPNDVVLTPSWCWHGHRNDGDAPAYWLDYLDSPFCRSVDQYVFEPFPGDYETVTATAVDSPYVYPWRELQRALAVAPADPSGRLGRPVVLDRFPLRTIGLTMQALDRGTRTVSFATSANNVYTAVAGTGRSVIDGHVFRWERGDVVIAPAGRPQYHEADEDAVLFCVSDAPLLESVGLFRGEDAQRAKENPVGKDL
ncbi:MAG TPA: cupin domain-containing protein [Candidatus Lustribacter sp.]|nr:cupin domain-containing protein [Candidatus Lustribacter sp.]